MDGQQGKLAQEEQNLAELETDALQAQKAYENALQQQGFSAEADFLEARLERAEISKLQQQVKDHEIRWQITQNDLERLQRETEGKETIDTSAYQEKCTILKETREALEQQDRQLHTITQNNQSALAAARTLYQKRADMDQKHKILNSLNDTANGKKHMKFQTYVQRYFFKTIIASANQRLYRMSGGQFILQCRDVKDLGRQGYVGLDLDVYSIVNEQCRDVKTLSGGESFMAALSMALGMADIIQNSTGSVHIDTMFIDEGFGSLSEETRSQAIQVLSELSEGKRLVGIISHVSELKAQVETKLVVTKSEKGSRARWE
jgi:exonuclease SbcC